MIRLNQKEGKPPVVDVGTTETLDTLSTEQVNPGSKGLDRMSALEIATVMNDEDATVAAAVRTQLPRIAEAVEQIAARLRRGGRLIYIGAGTSGRLGVLDASECPPTFNASPDQILGWMAGGEAAMTRSIEEAEDDPELARRDIERLKVAESDAMVGIAASGRTPYVLGAVAAARERGALTIGLACNPRSPLEKISHIMIVSVVGPEVVSGSTRLKAGTAQKMVLNMLSTGVMVLLGKTYDNLMVDLRASNTKLRKRAVSIVQQATGVSGTEAEVLLQSSGNDVKTAIVASLASVSSEEARVRLAKSQGVVWAALSDTDSP